MKLSKLLDWLRLFRAQTAPATVFAIMIPYIVFGKPSLFEALILFLVAHVLHYASFGHNSLMDWLMGFDRHDPNKRHHPLPSGRITEERAAWVIHGLLFLSLTGLGIVATIHNNALALLMLLLYAVWGYAYNNGLDHLSENAWIPISLAFGFLPLYSYFLVNDKLLYAVLLWLWGFTVTFYQIDWEGNIKDMWNPTDRSANKLRRKGICDIVYNRIVCVKNTSLWYMALRIFSHSLAVLLALLLLLRHSLWVMLYTAGIYAAAILLTMMYHVEMSVMSKREEALENMGLQEVLAFYVLLLLLLPVRPLPMLLLALYGVGYFVAMNKLLWSTRFGPRV